MKNISPLIVFLLLLTSLLGISFYAHAQILTSLSIPFTSEDLKLPYGINFILAASITSVLYLFREKQARNLGFIFMASSLLKFLVFFLFIYPSYNEDGDLSKVEFGCFFVPYAISLTLETVFLIRIMNRMDD